MKYDASQVETDLLQRLQHHDDEALALIMKKYYNSLYNYAFRFLPDDGLVKDCIQEVFISLWQRRDTARQILSLKYYLLRAAKNKVLKCLHQGNRKGTLSGLNEEYDFFQEYSIEQIIIEKQISEEKAEKLKKTLCLLSKRQQEIIYLKYYQLLDHKQIAELMNLSSQSVYNLLHETVQKLRNVWHAEFITRLVIVIMMSCLG